MATKYLPITSRINFKCLSLSIALATAAILRPELGGAFSLTPITTSVEPSGPGASQAFLVSNDSDESVAAEIYVFPRSPDIDGKESMEKKPGMDKLFLIYPPQFVLKARERRTVRVTWIGDPKPPQELAFRLVAEQLPVLTEKKDAAPGAQIKVLLKYAGALYVTPKGTSPEVVVKEAAVLREKGKGPVLAFELANRGSAHRVLKNFTMKIAEKGNAEPTSIESEKLPELNGQNMLAGSSRRFKIPLPLKVKLLGVVKVEFDFKD